VAVTSSTPVRLMTCRAMTNPSRTTTYTHPSSWDAR
jgi:hypothetical protein